MRRIADHGERAGGEQAAQIAVSKIPAALLAAPRKFVVQSTKADVGSNVIFSTRDELSTVGLMQPRRPRQFGAASAGAESKWRAGAAAP
jgi:hypothetical protein